MAKRKRLSPVTPEQANPVASPAELETKSAFPAYPQGVAVTRTHGGGKSAPIADVARETASAAALAELSDSVEKARQTGRMVLELPLDAIQADYLVRDRIAVDDDDMQSLMASLRSRGQQTPIEVTALDNGRYGLISGWRRLTALQRLSVEDAGSDTVLALLRLPSDSADAYLAMVEENEIRVGLSYYERARVAARAVDQGVFETEKKALLSLYHAASRAKRSKIRSFLSLVRGLDDVLKWPHALTERLGLALAKAMDEDADLRSRLTEALTMASPQTQDEELKVVQGILAPAKTSKPTPDLDSKPTAPVDLPGLTLLAHKDGSLRLAGPALDADLRDELTAWLKTRLG